MGHKYRVSAVCGGKADIFFSQKWLVERAIGNVHMTSDDNVHQISVWVPLRSKDTLLLQLVESPRGVNAALHNCDHLRYKKKKKKKGGAALIYMTSVWAFSHTIVPNCLIFIPRGYTLTS